MVGFDRLKYEFFLKGNGVDMRLPHDKLPVRPIMGRHPVANMTGTLSKLGFKKTLMGKESWQNRHVSLSQTSLSYAKDKSGSTINSIPLSQGVKATVANATTPARNDRLDAAAHD